jgi:hypothetical protein
MFRRAFMIAEDQNTISREKAEPGQETIPRPAHHVQTDSAPPNPLEPEPAGFPRKLLLAVGVIVAVGLIITLLVIRTSASGWPGPSPSALLTNAMVDSKPVLEIAKGVSAQPPAATVRPVREASRVQEGPRGIVAVPSAGLRTHPSLASAPLKTVVRANEKVRILKRVSPDSGPAWLQIETSSGKVGWVWASVVKEGERRKRG